MPLRLLARITWCLRCVSAFQRWKKSQALAGLQPEPRQGWHLTRRRFDSNLEELPLKILCKLGGWKETQKILRRHRQADAVRPRKALDTRPRGCA